MYKVGDTAEYRGQLWQVGFVNKRKFAGTLRLQKSGIAGAEGVNYVDPADVRKVQKRRTQND